MKYRDILLSAILNGAKDQNELVRASSLSNLGELCRLLRFSLGGVLHEVSLCKLGSSKYRHIVCMLC